MVEQIGEGFAAGHPDDEGSNAALGKGFDGGCCGVFVETAARRVGAASIGAATVDVRCAGFWPQDDVGDAGVGIAGCRGVAVGCTVGEQHSDGGAGESGEWFDEGGECCCSWSATVATRRRRNAIKFVGKKRENWPCFAGVGVRVRITEHGALELGARAATGWVVNGGKNRSAVLNAMTDVAQDVDDRSFGRTVLAEARIRKRLQHAAGAV